MFANYEKEIFFSSYKNLNRNNTKNIHNTAQQNYVQCHYQKTNTVETKRRSTMCSPGGLVDFDCQLD